jgi:hypothetical protein
VRTRLPADECGKVLPPSSEQLFPELRRSKAKTKQLDPEISEAAYALKGAHLAGDVEQSEAARPVSRDRKSRPIKALGN